jgi:hypothetical protein
MVPLLLAVGFSFQLNGPSRNGITGLFIVLYTAAYSPGAGVSGNRAQGKLWVISYCDIGCAISLLKRGVC